MVAVGGLAAGSFSSAIRPDRPPPSLGGSPTEEVIVIYPDNQTLRMLVQERHADLARDAFGTDTQETFLRAIRIRRRRRRAQLSPVRFRFRLRPARGGS
jgi:hypothetical protein